MHLFYYHIQLSKTALREKLIGGFKTTQVLFRSLLKICKMQLPKLIGHLHKFCPYKSRLKTKLNYIKMPVSNFYV